MFAVREYVAFCDDTVAHLESMASIVGSNCTVTLTFENPTVAAELIRAFEEQSHITAAAICDGTNAPFAHYMRSDTDLALNPVVTRADGYHIEYDEMLSSLKIYLKSKPLVINGDLIQKKDVDSSTGMGVSIAYNGIITLLVGQLLVDSTEGIVTTFRDRICMACLQTIFFVVDERSMLSSLRRLIHREGWNLLFAQNGMEGLEKL